MTAAFDSAVVRYSAEKKVVDEARQARMTAGRGESADTEDDRGGTDTFFAWFFRGEGPKGLVSGARIAQPVQCSLGLHTEPSSKEIMWQRCLASSRGRWRTALATVDLAARCRNSTAEIQRRAVRFLSARTTRHPAYARFVAAQAAALELLGDSKNAKAEFARLVFEQVYQGEAKRPHATKPLDVLPSLGGADFFH